MRKFFVLIVITLAQAHLFSQTLPKKGNQANWQQKVSYSIQVSLNDKDNILNGYEKITYFNQSPDILNEIYMHLWPNAYKNRNTAYAKQELENGHTNFHFADPNSRGWIDSLEFRVNGEIIQWQYTENMDIALLKLNTPLKPGESILITTPFKVKIPAVFSRLGVEDGVFCITQWYPKPAVYDINGWNPMPYLNQGEFYSEFGKFDVSITLPKNYLLAATGEVKDPAEKEWWMERSKKANAEHFAPGELKTLRFVQDSVHDFAWFACKKFMSNRGEVELSNGKIVETWIFAKSKGENKKPDGIEHVNDGVSFYSEKVGNYPYSIAQVVITPLKAGGGMEYPTITNCASNSKTTIVHEVGHNWFYGILGSNEREYPWMDESFNTYYENRNAKESKSNVFTHAKKGKFQWLNNINQSDILFQYASRKNTDQAGNLSSVDYTDNNYGAIIYAKNPLAIGYLQGYLGTEKFDAMMQAYYEKWKFKHPLPLDFKQHAESFTASNLSWFFDIILGSTQKMDYKLVAADKDQLLIKNKGNAATPISITQYTSDTNYTTKWIAGFQGRNSFNISTLGFTDSSASPNLYYRLDGEKQTLDLYRQNNTAIVRGWCENCKTIQLQPLLNLESDHAAQTFWAPVYAWNYYNKSMLGLAFYNSVFPERKNEYLLMPVFSFETKDVNGYAQYWHNWYTTGKIRNIQVGFKASRFGTQSVFYRSNDPILQTLIVGSGGYYGPSTYEKFAPFVQLKLQPGNRRSRIDQEILLRYVMVNEQSRGMGYFNAFGSDHYAIANLKYTYNNPNVLYPSSATIDFQKGMHNVTFNKLSIEINQGIKYKDGKKTAQIRLFAGGFLLEKTDAAGSRDEYYSSRAYFQAAAKTGGNDYLYDESMMGRELSLGNINTPNPGNTSSENLYGRQILYSDAGFRNFAKVGSSNSLLTALNLTIPAPIPVPIGLYADFSYWQLPSGYVKISGSSGTSYSYYPAEMLFTYNGGIYLQLIKNVCSIYVPLVSSTDVSGYWIQNGYNSFFSRTSFMLNLNLLNPIQAIRNLKL